MTFHWVDRLRAFALIFALTFALVGQAFVPAAMAMQPEGTATASISALPSDMCKGCKDMDHSKASECGLGVCVGTIAILPQMSRVEATSLAAFPGAGQLDGQGLTIPPPLGPPRSLHLI